MVETLYKAFQLCLGFIKINVVPKSEILGSFWHSRLIGIKLPWMKKSWKLGSLEAVMLE